MTSKNMEARREAFEAWWREQLKDVAPETLPAIAFCKEVYWYGWNAALDSICVGFPKHKKQLSRMNDYEAGEVYGFNEGVDKCAAALTAAGVAYK